MKGEHFRYEGNISAGQEIFVKCRETAYNKYIRKVSGVSFPSVYFAGR